MSELDFKTSFKALTAESKQGFLPFEWQSRLFRELCEGRIPQALDIPTGLGKTSVIALWLLARAAGANLPLRLIYVVDRRTVVDQATDYALTIRENLKTLPELKAALGLSHSLPISTLRGQYGLVPLSCRPQCSFRPLGVRRPMGFCLPMRNADGAGYRSR